MTTDPQTSTVAAHELGADGPVLLVSEDFDYSTMICDDAGPAYARRQNWPVAPVSQLGRLPEHSIPVVDSRLSSAEMLQLLGAAEKGVPFAYRVVDRTPDDEGHPVRELSRSPGVRLVSPYAPDGVTAGAVARRGPGVFHLLPYAYDRDREKPIDGQRARTVALFGRASWSVYPDRTRLMAASRKRPWLRWMLDSVEHPGYSDVGEDLQHDIVGDRMIERLSRSRGMYVDPSARGYELLRYSECAYAGCIPVGEAPPTFESSLAELVLPLDTRRPTGSLIKVLAMTSAAAIRHATSYRAALAEARDPAKLTHGLVQWWRLT